LVFGCVKEMGERRKALSWPNLLFEMGAYINRHYANVAFFELGVQ
jgi:hypothetical protein